MRKVQKIAINKEKLFNIILNVIIFAELCAVAAFILQCTEKYFQSDMASAVLLAQEERAQMSLIPDNFIHSTGIMIFNINLLIAPLLGFFDNLIFCREIAVIIEVIIFAVVFLRVFKDKSDKYSDISKKIGVMVALLPVSYWVTFEYFYEAVYLAGAIKLIFIIYLLKKVMAEENKKRYYAFLGLYAVTIFLVNIDSFRNYLFVVIPMILAIILVPLMEEKWNISQTLKRKKYMIVSAVTFVSGSLGILAYKILARTVLSESADSKAMFVASEDVFDKIGAVINNIFDLYGATGECYLMSLTAVVRCICLVYMIFMVVVFPVIAVRKFNCFGNYKRIIITFVLCSNAVVIFTQIFTSLCETRYLLQLYINNIVLMVIVLPYMLSNIKQKEVKYIFYACVLILVAMVQGKYFMSETVATAREEKAGVIKADEKELIEFLKEKDLTYGFATYWNAYGNMVLSNNEIKIVAYKEEPLTPYYWMTNKEWYDVEQNKGRCFILLGEGETVDSIYHQEADEKYRLNGYIILVYNENIHLNEDIVDKIERLNGIQ